MVGGNPIYRVLFKYVSLFWAHSVNDRPVLRIACVKCNGFCSAFILSFFSLRILVSNWICWIKFQEQSERSQVKMDKPPGYVGRSRGRASESRPEGSGSSRGRRPQQQPVSWMLICVTFYYIVRKSYVLTRIEWSI